MNILLFRSCRMSRLYEVEEFIKKKYPDDSIFLISNREWEFEISHNKNSKQCLFYDEYRFGLKSIGKLWKKLKNIGFAKVFYCSTETNWEFGLIELLGILIGAKEIIFVNSRNHFVLVDKVTILKHVGCFFLFSFIGNMTFLWFYFLLNILDRKKHREYPTRNL